ncbi:phospholipase D/nuclease [Rickenella mellea]|uniref:Phospholipase D/nuclease n=1 Tax=Rickenella mellea TaxID=50990 RepID=A0A4Y7QIM9_9AGAM|nr:phospholipase D/nuclease [Rickenella mellea]
MSDDEDIARAIALSLQEAQSAPARTPSAPDSDDEDDEARFEREMQTAIEASKAESSLSSNASSRNTNGAVLIKQGVPPADPSVNAFMSERARMEKERLERQKRLRLERGESVDELAPPPSKRQRDSSYNERRRGDTSVRSTASGTASTSSSGRATPNGQQGASGASDGTQELFWEGTLRQTANKNVDPRKDTKSVFRLSELIGSKSEIEFAMISSYALQLSWVYQFFDPRTPVILVSQPDEDGNATIKNILPNWVRTTPFLRGGRGCMHIKFFLIFYKSGRLRVAVPTANLVDFDWRDIENTVWTQDVPLRTSPHAHDPKATDFPATLQKVLHALNVPAALTSHLNGDHPRLPMKFIGELRTKWDWSKVKVQLVASIAGRHEGWPEVIRTGHTALMKAVRDVNARAGRDREVVLECQGSSIGTYSTQWMNEFHHSARGDSAEDWLDGPRARRAKLPQPPIKIIFPSLQTVKSSVLGVPGGGTMFCRKNQWEGAKFPRELFYDSNSKRGGVLMHTKMIIATFKPKANISGSSSRRGKQRDFDTDSEDEERSTRNKDDEGVNKNIHGWAYVGSHNFTPSAWGTLSGSAFTPVLNIVNYEMGIVMPFTNEKDADDIAAWVRPPRKYVANRDRAWIQDEVLAPLLQGT